MRDFDKELLQQYVHFASSDLYSVLELALDGMDREKALAGETPQPVHESVKPLIEALDMVGKIESMLAATGL